MNKKLIPALALAMIGMLAACSGGSSNAKKPLVWFNRQPSDPTTGAIDTKAMSFNDSTYYVGFDAAGGGAVQGTMITDFLKTKTAVQLDKNGDGEIGYVLCIGDKGHNDSKARTKGIRTALGTWDETKQYAVDGAKENTAGIAISGGTLKVKEIACKEMKSTAGATWDAATATETMTGWATQLGTAIDMVVSNNDGMAMGCLSATNYPSGTPIFGYDANADAVEAITKGKLTGTVSQNVDAQAMGVLQLLRNMFDGVTGDDVVKKGVSVADKYGNKITPTMAYNATDRALMAANSAVTADNAANYKSGTRDAGVKQITATEKKVLLTLYSSSDNFLSSSYKPALQYYAPLLKLNLNILEGDGSSESSVTDKFTGLSNYDGYAINMVKTNSGTDYTNKLK